MTFDEEAELRQRLTELKSEAEMIALLREVARKYGKDDQRVLNLGEYAAMILASHKRDLSP